MKFSIWYYTLHITLHKPIINNSYKHLPSHRILADKVLKITFKIEEKNIARNMLENHIEQTS